MIMTMSSKRKLLCHKARFFSGVFSYSTIGYDFNSWYLKQTKEVVIRRPIYSVIKAEI